MMQRLLSNTSREIWDWGKEYICNHEKPEYDLKRVKSLIYVEKKHNIDKCNSCLNTAGGAHRPYKCNSLMENLN